MKWKTIAKKLAFIVGLTIAVGPFAMSLLFLLLLGFHTLMGDLSYLEMTTLNRQGMGFAGMTLPCFFIGGIIMVAFWTEW